MNTALDATDIEILRRLQRDGRISNANLARAVNLSESACFKRVKRLEQSRTIVQYQAIINRRAFHQAVTFIAQLQLDHQKLEDLLKLNQYLHQVQEITEVFAVEGEADYLLRLIARDITQYISIMDSIMEKFNFVKKYSTQILMRTLKQTPPPLDYIVGISPSDTP